MKDQYLCLMSQKAEPGEGGNGIGTGASSQQNSDLVLPGKSQFVNPKRKRIYSKIREDKRLLGFTAGLTSQAMRWKLASLRQTSEIKEGRR